jgi:DNA modification methylase
LQADGWYLRQDIIWSKPNPMPESVRDRCTKAHEYIFLLSKSERYYYDQEAIAEPCAWGNGQRVVNVDTPKNAALGLKPTREYGHELEGGRNKRSVWEVTTSPFPEAHFATFPPALIEPCILAGCPEKCCAKCGAPWVRNTESGETTGKGSKPGKPAHLTPQGYLREGKSRCGDAIKITLNWSPYAGTNPGTVLDPFGGAGTTGLVADRLGRNAILIELNPEYAGMAQRRIQSDAGLFADVVA